MQNKKKADEALGKSRGGVTTKIPAVTDELGRCIDFTLTEGQIHDCTQAESLLEEKSPENVLADKGYDTHIYKERHPVENFFQFIKRFRRIGTRYEMSAQNYAGMVTIACILQWIIF